MPCAQRIGCGHSESGLRCLGGGVVMPRVSCMCAQQRLRWQLLTWNTTWNICGRALGSWSCPVSKALILCLYTMQRRGGKTYLYATAVACGCGRATRPLRPRARAAAPRGRPPRSSRVAPHGARIHFDFRGLRRLDFQASLEHAAKSFQISYDHNARDTDRIMGSPIGGAGERPRAAPSTLVRSWIDTSPLRAFLSRFAI